MVRRVRILTAQAMLAASPDHVLASADTGAILSLIVHKVCSGAPQKAACSVAAD